MSPSGIHLNKSVTVTIIGAVVTIVLVFTYYKGGSVAGRLEMAIPETQSWKTKPFVEIPADAKADLDTVTVNAVKDFNVTIGGKEVNVFYREAVGAAPKMDVLFLHGQAFKSQTWVDSKLKSLQLLSKLGYRAVAIDLPGFGNSPAVSVDHAAYLESVIVALKLRAPVIVSPSMSGGFALPYLFKDAENVLKRSRGFVPVAPVQTESYSPDQYRTLRIPTMHICGKKDSGIGRTAIQNLQNLPNYVLFMLKDARHPAYLDQPEDFHKYLYNFLLALQT